MQYPGSALVLDIKEDNFAVKRNALGQAVYCVDPFQVTGSEGHAFNWLAALDPDDPNVVSDSAMLAEMLVIPDKHVDSYWDDGGERRHFPGRGLWRVPVDFCAGSLPTQMWPNTKEVGKPPRGTYIGTLAA